MMDCTVEFMRRFHFSGTARVWMCLLLGICTAVSAARGQSGSLETVREDVRGEGTSGSDESSGSLLGEVGGSLLSSIFGGDSSDSHRYHDSSDGTTVDDANSTLFFGAVLLGGAVVTSPIWVPINVVEDGRGPDVYFPRFPYDHTPGYMIYHASPGMQYAARDACGPRRWSGRVRFDYSDDFDDLERTGFHLLLSTSSRLGIETEMGYLQEQFADKPHDRIWLGDCNAIIRFAQSEHMQWRTGLGFNWLDDDVRTDFGFNFTYGMDYFPKRPWVISSTLDWGTIGSAELFRIRATGGVIVHGIEGFVGYEYFDLDRTQIGGLIAGLRVWF